MSQGAGRVSQRKDKRTGPLEQGMSHWDRHIDLTKATDFIFSQKCLRIACLWFHANSIFQNFTWLWSLRSQLSPGQPKGCPTPEEGSEIWGACSTLMCPSLAVLRDSPWEMDPPWGEDSSAPGTPAVVTAEWKEMASKETSLARDSNGPWQRAEPRGKPLCAPHFPAR